jgi:hypothetical protein
MKLVNPVQISALAAPLATSDLLRWTNRVALNRADPRVFLHTDRYDSFTPAAPEYNRRTPGFWSMPILTS